MAEPAYIAIAQAKQAQLRSQIPQEWTLPVSAIPPGMLSPADSTFNAKYQRVNTMDIPRTCGLLSSRELEITEAWDAKGLLARIAEQQVSSEEVITAFCKVSTLLSIYLSIYICKRSNDADYIQRAAIAHQLTRCLTEPLFNSALAQARNLDAHLRRTGKPLGPLHGLPVSLKDTFHVAGTDSTIGLAAFASQPARETAPLAELLTSLGAVIIAKTNVPQTLGALDSCNNLFGRTLNPLNRQLTAGGSSGGEGVLIAMRGAVVGFGTDIGGSIRVPAMCNGVYGFKPSVGRVPFGGQRMGQIEGKGRMALQTVAGPLAGSVQDLDAVMAEIVPRAELFGADCVPGMWPSLSVPKDRGLTVGVLKSDGLVQTLPPIVKVLEEVGQTLRRTPGVNVVEIPVPPALSKCQALAGRLMGVDDGATMMDILESTGEPLIPWLQGRMKRGKALTVQQLAQLQAQRSQVEKELLSMWTLGNKAPGSLRQVDAIILPVAPHPVPEIDRYNAVGYTSTFVLLDYPAGTVPVRKFVESDLESGKEMTAPVLGSWDKANRALCMFFPLFFDCSLTVL